MQTTRNFVVFLSLIIGIFAVDIPSENIFATPGTLYTLPNDTLQLGFINAQTGKITTFGPAYNDFIVSEQLTALDYANQLLYSVAYNINNGSVFLVALDLTTGAMKNQIVLPFAESFFIGVGQGLDVDPATGDVFVFGRETAAGPHTFIRVNPTQKTFKSIATFNGIDIIGGVAAYDPLSKIFWAEVASTDTINYYGIDVNSGDLVWNLTDDYDLETLAWDPATRLMYGFGLAGNETIYRTIVTLNSKNGQLNQIATLEQYSIIYAGESTLDWTNRILYAILQPQGPDNTPFELVGVHMKSGKVVSNPQVCVTECPWTLEFFNKPWH